MPLGRVRWPRWALARVSGTSMEPTLWPGDLLLITYAARARPGAVVVVELPTDTHGRPRPIAVKRLVGYRPEGALWVESDNTTDPSRIDSWTLGALPSSSLVARVICRVNPPGRVRQAPPTAVG